MDLIGFHVRLCKHKNIIPKLQNEVRNMYFSKTCSLMLILHILQKNKL